MLSRTRGRPIIGLATLALLSAACSDHTPSVVAPSLRAAAGGASANLISTQTTWDFATLAGFTGPLGSPKSFTIAGAGTIVATAQTGLTPAAQVYSKGWELPAGDPERGLGLCRDWYPNGDCAGGTDAEIGDNYTGVGVTDGISPSLYLDFTGLTAGTTVQSVTLGSLQYLEGYQIYWSVDGVHWTLMVKHETGPTDPLVVTLPVPTGAKFLRFDRDPDGGAGDNYVLMSLTTVAPASNCAVVQTQLGAASSGGFTLLALNNGTMIINSSTSIVGNVGYSAFVTSTTNQKIGTFVGTSYVHSTANFVYTPATYRPTGGIIKGGVADVLLNQANIDVASASAYFAGLPSNGSLGNVTMSSTLSASGPITVFDVSTWNYNSGTLTLNGGASSVFVFRVTGSFDWSQSQIVLNGGVQAANIVWYFPNASAIDINKSTNVFAGTVLAPTGSVIYHNPATFNGAIIAKSIDVHSDFNIMFPPCN